MTLGAAFVASRELSELASARYLEVADRLFSELNSAENITARRWVFHNLPGNPEVGLKSLSLEGRDHVKRVLNSLDRVAFLTQYNWIPDEIIMPWMNPMIVKSWSRLGSDVEYESRRRNEPDYYKMAHALAERCIQWREQNVTDADVTWLSDAL